MTDKKVKKPLKKPAVKTAVDLASKMYMVIDCQENMIVVDYADNILLTSLDDALAIAEKDCSDNGNSSNLLILEISGKYKLVSTNKFRVVKTQF